MTIDTIIGCTEASSAEARVATRRGARLDPRWLHPYALVMIVSTFLAKRRSRLALAKLDAAGLRDIGLTRDQALRESERIRWTGDWYV